MTTTTTTDRRPILVIGATGKTGRRVADRLRGRGIAVREGSRAATPAFDWEDRSTWAPALSGTRAAYVSFYPDLAAPGAADAVGELTRVAIAAGVEHLVLLSGRGEEEAQAAEAALQRSAIGWTVVRCSWFNQNFSEGYFVDGVAAGEMVLPAGAVAEPFVDADDIADVAVAALTEEGHRGQLYELTGPRLLTFAEATAEIAKALDREITYTYVPVDAYVAEAKAAGLPDDLVELIGYLFTTVLDGRNAHVADGVQRALGRPARDFYDYAWDAVQAGAWGSDGR